MGDTSSFSQKNNSTSPFTIWENGIIGANIIFQKEGKTSSIKNSRTYRQLFSLGYQHEYFSDINLQNSDNHIFSSNNHQNNISSLRLKYSYSDTEKYGYSISPEQGNAFSISYEHADTFFGGDYVFDRWLLDGKKYIPL